MLAILHTLGMFIIDLFKSRRRLEAENLFLRHQLSIALRRAPPRLRLRGSDRALLVWMIRLWPNSSMRSMSYCVHQARRQARVHDQSYSRPAKCRADQALDTQAWATEKPVSI